MERGRGRERQTTWKKIKRKGEGEKEIGGDVDGMIRSNGEESKEERQPGRGYEV